VTRERTLGWGERQPIDLLLPWVAAPAGALIVAFVALSATWYLGDVPFSRSLFGRGPADEPLGEVSNARAWYVVETPDPLTAGAQVTIGPDRPKVILTLDDMVFSATTGSLLRVRREGPAARVRAEEGRRVRLTNVGQWDSVNRQFEGLEASYADGRWELDAPHPKAANANHDFELGDEADPLPGYRLVPPTAGFVASRMQDARGAFVRVRATRPAPYLEITGAEPISSLEGAPVHLRGRVRAHAAAAELTLTLHDVVSPNGRAVDLVTRAKPSNSDEWTTLVVRTPKVVYASPDDYFSIGISPVSVDDWFDVSELSVFVGVFPNLGDFPAPTAASAVTGGNPGDKPRQ
jgi:hypothetical protein